ncbi:hypothetical protein M752DRAFT_310088 [Aspergillus phoenicis ATCC 13157]|uniref:PRISE-like Rossmann-fold domain-containing protein n=1 Tax=Aspergillus phoenicis ATCC 13157 TaxID=1353007 RepID=A0A370PWL9_ASPPH|nr:hypothetical protein M752DRAFT_310088 [Aspergillus phoenicis ATCC 13157]
MAATAKHALIFGASGISGWSLLNQTLRYPTATTFNRVTGLCNRPFRTDDALLPDDDRLRIVSGIDLTQPVEAVRALLKDKIDDVESVDVVFFCAYIQTSDFQSLRKVNTDLLRTAIEAISAVSSELKAVILQTGGKGYGLEFPKEIRPDGIVGIAPGTNAMNMAFGIAFYLTLYREINGKDAKVPFPGRPHGYHTYHTDTFQDVLAKMEIFAALNRDKYPNGSTFNCGDGEPVTWAQVWPGICSYFGLRGVEPDEKPRGMEEFVYKHKAAWDSLVEEKRLKKGLVESQN